MEEDMTRNRRRVIKSYKSSFSQYLLAFVAFAFAFVLCGCQKPVKMSETQAQSLLEEKLSSMIPETITGEFSNAKPIVTIYDMDIPSDNNGLYRISCSCSIDMGETPTTSYWKDKCALLATDLKTFNESAEGITLLGTNYHVDISANVDTAFYYDSDRWPYTVEADQVFKYTPDLSSATLVYPENEETSSYRRR